MKELLIPLGKIAHEMQKERGRVILYLCGYSAYDEKEMRARFQQTDQTVNEFNSIYTNWVDDNRLSENTKNRIGNLTANIDALNDRRDLILIKELNVTDSITSYSHKVIGPIIDVMVEIALNNPEYASNHVSAFSNFLNFKERIERERYIGARGLIMNTIDNVEFVENFRFLISEQDSYKDTFLQLATPAQKEIYENHMGSFSMQKVDELHDRMINNPSNDKDDITISEWLDLITEKVDLMQDIEMGLIDTLPSEKASPVKIQNVKNASDVQFGSFTNEQIDFIKTLPIFKGISDCLLSDLLKSATVASHKKGKLLFLEGENPDKLYIILDGWVKLYKGNSNGEETIVQMLTSGDMIAESAVFLNATYPISAQVAKTAEILTLPASIIRGNVEEYNELAINVLKAMSVHSQLLIQGMESIRLKSATERVGWYLLKLLLEQGRVPDMVELPYDKSIIASYLDMKPETFSRTLKKFKQKGFEIRKDAVILPQVKALCGFCDSDVAGICSRHGTPECPNPDCISSEEIVLFED